MKQGAADYLVKPFQLEGVVASVERAMEKKRLELEVENYRNTSSRWSSSVPGNCKAP